MLLLLPVLASGVVSSNVLRNGLATANANSTIAADNATLPTLPTMPSYVSSALGIFGFVRNLVKIRNHFGDISTLEKTEMVGDVMRDLDSLYVLHNVLKTKLYFRSVNNKYTCTDCDDAELDATFKFTRLTYTGKAFESANPRTCVLDLKRQMSDLGQAAEDMEAEAREEVDELAKGEVSEEEAEKLEPAALSFLQMDTAESAAWLSKNGFEKYAANFTAEGFNGLVLKAVTRSKLKQYLGMKTLTEAGALKCKIDAALVGVPASDCRSSRARLAYESSSVSAVDPYVFFGVKSLVDGLYAPKWWLSAVARGISNYKPGAKAQDNYTHSVDAPGYMATGLNYVYKALDWWYTEGAVQELAMTGHNLYTAEDYDEAVEAFNPIAIAGAVSYLVTQALEGYVWDNCAKINEKINENLWDKLTPQDVD